MSNSNAAAQARWRAANPEKSRAYIQASKGKNPEPYRAARVRWKAANRGKVQADHVRRRVSKSRRTPVWADLAKIEQVYEEAKVMTAMTGELWHVDHVIPLRGKLVSGLHVHTNLQLLLSQDNFRKRNKFEIQ